jgi:hypothetical protein
MDKVQNCNSYTKVAWTNISPEELVLQSAVIQRCAVLEL